MGPIGAGAADQREFEITLGRRRMAALELGGQRRYALKVVLGRGESICPNANVGPRVLLLRALTVRALPSMPRGGHCPMNLRAAAFPTGQSRREQRGCPFAQPARLFPQSSSYFLVI